MRARGKILRSPGAGPGLLIIDGRQYRFSATEWRSIVQPLPGMEVEALLDRSDQVTEIVASQAEPTRRERTARSGLEHVIQWLNERQTHGGERRS